MLVYGNNWLINVGVGSAIAKEGTYFVYLSLKFDATNKKVYCDKVLLIPKTSLK
jgi:hypothetical protein